MRGTGSIKRKLFKAGGFTMAALAAASLAAPAVARPDDGSNNRPQRGQGGNISQRQSPPRSEPRNPGAFRGQQQRTERPAPQQRPSGGEIRRNEAQAARRSANPPSSTPQRQLAPKWYSSRERDQGIRPEQARPGNRNEQNRQDANRDRQGYANRDRDRNWERDDRRPGEWDRDRNGRDARRDNDRKSHWGYDNDRNRYDGNRYGDRNRNWNRDWRTDNRYDWHRYRDRNRSTYRVGYYWSPYPSWSYRPLSIGFTLGSLFYGQRYWISDPWYYRLPPVYGPYRWVRYYDDVLLVDIYTGRVVDVIYDFFW